MAMTLRLSEEQDRALTFLAERQGVSKQEAATRAITAQAEQLGHEADVDEAFDWVATTYSSLLDRLGQ